MYTLYFVGKKSKKVFFLDFLFHFLKLSASRIDRLLDKSQTTNDCKPKCSKNESPKEGGVEQKLDLSVPAVKTCVAT